MQGSRKWSTFTSQWIAAWLTCKGFSFDSTVYMWFDFATLTTSALSKKSRLRSYARLWAHRDIGRIDYSCYACSVLDGNLDHREYTPAYLSRVMSYLSHCVYKLEFGKNKRLRSDTGLPRSENNRPGTTRSQLNRPSMICLRSLIRVRGAIDTQLICNWVREKYQWSGGRLTRQNPYCSRSPLRFRSR